MNRDKIFLVGFSGAGKTTLGKQLAEKLNYDFFDIDELIEQSEGISISTIFEKKGEIAFRKIENKVLTKTIFFPKTVIACGGGTPCFHDNMDFMLKQGTVIYLKVTEEELGTRIQNSDTPRPLFSDSKEYEKSVRRIKIMLEERKKDYQRAHITIENSNKDTEALDKILKAL